MTTFAVERRRGGLIDRRLAARVRMTRRYLVIAVLVGLLATVCVVAQAVLFGTVVSLAVLHRAPLGTLVPQLAGLGAAFVARGLCIWAGETAAQRTGAMVTSALRRQLLRHALDLGPTWLAGERAGELSLVATRGTTALDTYFGKYLPQAVLAALAPVGILAWVGWEDWPSSLILLGLVALVPVAMVLFGRESATRTCGQWRRMSTLSARFLELLRGLPTLRAFGREAQGRREVAAATEGLRQATMSTLRVAFLSALSLEFIAGIGTGLVAMVLGLRLLGGTVSLYSALAVLLVSPEVFLPLRRVGAEFHSSAEGQAAAERIMTVLDLEAPSRPPAGAVPAIHGHAFTLERVHVYYPGRAASASLDLDLTVGEGEHVALVGPSGAGKSTAIALLLGFVGPNSGRVLVGGVDLRAMDAGLWRRHVSWVPQRPLLVHGTIADNLELGDPSVSRREMEEVIELAGLSSMLDGLPRRLDTQVGEGGLTLSAGERQRLAIARAILRGAPVVLLDEPVAYLDLLTESELRDALSPWFAERTVLVAAHRPELVSRIDRVVELASPLPPDLDATSAPARDLPRERSAP